MIVITEFMDEAAVADLASKFEVVYDPALVDQPDRLRELMPRAEALIVRNRTQVTQALIDGAASLRCVGRLGVGLDNIDLDACKAVGVTVYPATGANNLSVAEYVIGTAMSLLRGAYDAKAEMLAGKWPRQACAGRELAGRCLGLVGFGAIARDTAARARALGMSVAGYDPFVAEDDPVWAEAERLSLEALLAKSDVVSLHVPLSPDTRHLIGAARLRDMKPGAVLINAARGGVVDEAAVASALREGRLGGAALDVFETEPLTEDAAAIFRDVPNLILTPHIAGVTEESNTRVSALIAERVATHLSSA